jgi:inhibitor of KinA
MTYRIFPLSETAVTVEFGNKISPELNDRAIRFAEALSSSPFEGMLEAAPAYSSVTVFFDAVAVRRGNPFAESAHAAVRDGLEAVLRTLRREKHSPDRTVDIPFSAGKDVSLDLDFVASESGLSPEEVLEIFVSRTYRVYMLGFLPGFAYMGDLDPRIAVPRRATPRIRVPRGSVAVAGRQTGIYSLESPGGWHVLGRTSVSMFAPQKSKPCLVEPGDEIRFTLIRT